MWRRVSCEQPLNTSQSILRDREIPHTQALPRLSKGNGVNIPQPGRGYCTAT